MRQRVASVIVAIVIASCGGAPTAIAPGSVSFAPSPTATATQAATPSPTAVPGDAPGASGFASSRIGVGHLVAPHQDKGYIAFFEIRQAPGLQADLSHQGGFVYMLDGSVRISEYERPFFEVKTSDAGYVNWGARHTSENPGTTPSRAYFLSENNTSFRSAPVEGFPQLTTVVYASPQLPTFQLVAHTMTLDRVVLQPGGRSAAHTGGGAHGFLVLEGGIEVRTKDGHAFVGPGNATSLPLGTPVQILNTNAAPTRYLDFAFTADDQPFETILDHAP